MLYLNNEPLHVTMFPDKTSQVWKLPESTFKSTKALVLWDFSHEGEIMHLAQLQELLTKFGIETTLKITYLPYGRQDKAVSNDATFALNTFLNIVRNLGFKKLIVVDPHNFDALRPGCQCECIYPIDELESAIEDCAADLVCYPDKGALNKYTKIYSYDYIYGEKVRDQLTGNILSYSVVGNPSGKNVMIIDDICDGGATFKLLAKDLLAAGAKSVVLFVTHGIFSRGLQTLKDSGIQRVFTKDGEADELEGQIIYL